MSRNPHIVPHPPAYHSNVLFSQYDFADTKASVTASGANLSLEERVAAIETIMVEQHVVPWRGPHVIDSRVEHIEQVFGLETSLLASSQLLAARVAGLEEILHKKYSKAQNTLASGEDNGVSDSDTLLEYPRSKDRKGSSKIHAKGQPKPRSQVMRYARSFDSEFDFESESDFESSGPEDSRWAHENELGTDPQDDSSISATIDEPLVASQSRRDLPDHISTSINTKSGSGTEEDRRLGYLKSGRFTDLTIICQDQSFYAHRAIICKSSTYFEKVCDAHSVEWPAPVVNTGITVYGIEPSVLARTLAFCYTDDYPYPGNGSIGRISDIFDQIGGLTEAQEEKIPLTLHASMFDAGKHFGMPELVKLSEKRYTEALASGPLYPNDFIASIEIVYSRPVSDLDHGSGSKVDGQERSNAKAESTLGTKCKKVAKTNGSSSESGSGPSPTAGQSSVRNDGQPLKTVPSQPETKPKVVDLRGCIVSKAQKYNIVLRNSGRFLGLLMTNSDFMLAFATHYYRLDHVWCDKCKQYSEISSCDCGLSNPSSACCSQRPTRYVYCRSCREPEALRWSHTEGGDEEDLGDVDMNTLWDSSRLPALPKFQLFTPGSDWCCAQ